MVDKRTDGALPVSGFVKAMITQFPPRGASHLASGESKVNQALLSF